MFLVAEIAGLDEIHDAPQIQQPVFQRRAGERQAVLGLELLDRLRDLRAGILDELRLVQNHRAEREFLQLLQIAPEQRVIRHDHVVLRNLLAQIVPRRAAFQHEHLQVRREPLRLAPPVVQHGRRADDERRLGIFRVALLEPRQPGERLQRFAEAHVVGQDAAELDLREVAEKIEAVLLIRAQIGLQTLGQFHGGNALEIPDALAQRLRLRRIGKTRQLALVQMRDVFQADLLRHGDEAVHAHFGHRLVRALHGGGVEFHPAGVRQLDEAAGRGGEPFKVRLGKFEPFGLPFGGDGQPVNAAALDDQPRLELARLQEQAVKRRVAEEFRLVGALRPHRRERAEKIFVRVANPQAGLRREPVELAQPLDRRFQARVVEDFRLVGRPLFRLVRHPFVAVPKPDALVAETFGQQPQPHRVVEQLKNELRLGRMRDAKLLPVHAVIRLRLAQVQQQAMAQFAHRHGRLVREIFQHRRRRRVAQQIKRAVDQRQRRLAVEKFRVGHGMSLAAGQFDAVRERKFLVAVFEVRRERGNLAEKMERPAIAFQPRDMPPARQPLEQFGVGQYQRVRAVVAMTVRVGKPLDEFPVGGRKQFLLVRGADDEVNQIPQRARLFAGARTQQQKLHGQTVARRLLLVRLHPADDAERGARRVEQRQRGRRQPVFEFLDEALFLLGLLGPGETVEAGVRLQFRRHGTFGAQK